MAESMVGSFAGGMAHGLVMSLLVWIEKEVKSLGELPDEIKKINRELEFMKSLLEDRPSDNSSALKSLSLELRDAAHAAEEVLDRFSYIVSKCPKARVIGVRRAISLVATAREKRKIAASTAAVLSSIDTVRRDLGLNFPVNGRRLPSFRPTINSPPTHQPKIEDRPHVGFHSEMEQLMELLLRGSRRRVVVGVDGMGGSGKSTLVSKAYQKVRSKFQRSAWVVISQSYKSIEDIKLSIARQLSNGRLAGGAAVMNQLRGKRYLIVLDDVWDVRVWYALNFELPDDSRGSRVVVTTRSENVVSSLGEQRQSLKLKPLSSEHAWKLFCMEAFGERGCPQDLKPSAQAIVSRCGGLPLGIVTIASFMASREQSAKEWEDVLGKLGWHLSTKKMLDEVKRIVLLSFDQLPYYLKHCFLYLSIFPGDVAVKKNKLVRLWIAEGFVEESQVWSLEEQAEEYLKELVNLNLLEVSTKTVPTPTNSSSSCYKMHGIIRELAQQIAEEEKFLLVHDGQKTLSQTRRLSIQTRGEATLNYPGGAHLHSIVNFDTSPDLIFPIKDIWPFAKFLKVLDLDGARIHKCPDGVDELFNLRYLSLRRTGTSKLPRDFRKLPNLITLDLRDTKLNRLHFGIIRSSRFHRAVNPYLNQLRHFFVGASSLSPPDVSHGIPAPDGVSQSKNLQKLTFIKADSCFVSDVGKLTQLKKLGITDVREEHWKDLCASIKKMTKLRHLSVAAAPEHQLVLESLSSGDLSSTLPIQKLVLVGWLRDRELHPWIGSLKSLTHLRLVDSGLSEDPNPTPALAKLESLEEIELRNAYVGKVLSFPSESFARLRKLQLCDLPNLEEIVVNKGALPSIEEMHFYDCKKMKSSPIHDREYLRKYNIYSDDMPEFARSPSKQANQHL